MLTAIIVDTVIAAAAVGATGLAASLRVIKQYERGVVFRFGRALDTVKSPGLVRIMPIADRIRKVNLQVVTMPVPAQEGITRDNVTVRVDAVVYFRVVDPARAIIAVQDYQYAVSLVAQTSLRSIIGKSLLDDLLSNREPLNQGMELMLETPATGWGVEIDRVEIKDVALPESMKRSMARQAEADRERRARIIVADGEFQASAKLSEAARVMAETPAALQLRLLQTIVEVAAEKNSTLVLPFPVELLRFLENQAGGPPKGSAAATTGESEKSIEALENLAKQETAELFADKDGEPLAILPTDIADGTAQSAKPHDQTSEALTAEDEPGDGLAADQLSIDQDAADEPSGRQTSPPPSDS
jgi:regulator of protease activity HflC (stomatin/prohibitin superfamily)